ncbi:acetyl-CoA carboxylase, biotin carboxylase subunit [Modicisalibacter muralis]|uniref:Biotin carboxylase n=1 Tax=Modicisalibacter muralis TaxID=119000 RepID=A0A1G9LML2_9GAMM|nr:acetyl-CoA carboxylase biotin carboxylase subunit [Halomonas muralis]SDL63148.1 acetyl-CoA carboxylase, biotin carboxylase subunit [Halomonas muralis]
MPIKKVLIANRGEIALRVIRACRELGIGSVQAYSSADKDSLPVRLADESVEIGGPQATESYLKGSTIIAAAKEFGADAIHPGYGFLSENPDFAEECAGAGLAYIGPQASIIRVMGDKAAARRLAVEAGVPVTPGSDGPAADSEAAVEVARSIGFPVLIKASAGGGGRGMRVVKNEDELREVFERASHEAAVAFGSGAVYVEKYLDKVRHIEVQVFGDGERVVHVGERDCSIQRRHQKLVEESPSPAVDEAMRERITTAARRLAERVNYRSAGTVEFIVDTATNDFYFIEMNTRIQVEHPVTEEVTGLDLIKEQIRVASGESMSLYQEDIKFFGHAIECRINAEDPDKGFMPRPGKLEEFTVPLGPGVRVDSHAYPGYVLPPYYDSLLAKVVTRGQTREEALARMRCALAEFQITGVPTTIGFHQRLLNEPAFLEGRVHTRYLKEEMWAGHPMQEML